MEKRVLKLMSKTGILPLVIAAVMFGSMEVSAQGWLDKALKKVDNALNEVDKVLKTDEQQQQQTPQQTQQTQQTQQQQTENAEKIETKVIKPFVSANTKTITIDRISELEQFYDGLAFIKKAKKVQGSFNLETNPRWGVIDTLGNIVIDFVLDYSSYYTNPFPHYNSGVCVTDGQHYPSSNKYATIILDKKGKIVKELKDVAFYTQFKDSVAHVQLALTDANKKKFYRFAYINTKGEFVYPHLTVDVKPELVGAAHNLSKSFCGLKEGLRSYWSYKTGRGFIDAKGNIAVEPKYRATHDFSDGLAAVQNFDEKWGFIDKTGKAVIDFIFTNEPTDFHEGLAVVKKRDNSTCFIDKNGNLIEKIGKYTLKPEWDGTWNGVPPIRYSRFINGKAFVDMEDENGNRFNAILDRDMNHFRRFNTARDRELDGVFARFVSYDYAKDIIYLTNGAILTAQGKWILYYNAWASDFDYYQRFWVENGLARWAADYGNNYPEGFEKCYVNRNGEAKILFKEPQF
jgi:Sec-independent protein translocase protein TatA